MKDQQSFKKVLWRNGDVISNDHFIALEEWIEQLVGYSNRNLSISGFFRDPDEQVSYNNIDNISFYHIEGSRYRVDIEKLQGITPSGRIIKIDEKRSFDFLFKPTQRNPGDVYYLYVLPSSRGEQNNQAPEVELTTGLVLYESMYELSLSNDQNFGLLICRFKFDETTKLVVDKLFIPFGLYIDSSPMSLVARENLYKKFTLWNSLIEKYLKEKLSPNELYNLTIPTYNLLWTMTSQFIRANALLKPVIENKHEATVLSFKSFQQFVNFIRAEFVIFSVGWEQETEKQKALEVLNILQEPIVIPLEQQIDIHLTFTQAEKILDSLLQFLSYLPGGPIAEKTLPISRVEIIKETAGNRLNIYLEGETTLAKGKTHMTISLREFAKSEPLVKNIRVGMGSTIYAQLLDLKNLLRRVPGKVFSYTIDCPPEIVTQERASQLTLYLPPPLGEEIIDLKSHITIIVRD